TICRFKDPAIQTTMCPHSRCQKILANRGVVVRHHKNIHVVAGKDCAELQCRSYFEQNLRVVYAAARRGVAPQSSDSTTTVPSSSEPTSSTSCQLVACPHPECDKELGTLTLIKTHHVRIHGPLAECHETCRLVLTHPLHSTVTWPCKYPGCKATFRVV